MKNTKDTNYNPNFLASTYLICELSFFYCIYQLKDNNLPTHELAFKS